MSYRVLCDENVSTQTVRYLRREGHTAVHVASVLAPGVDDEAVVSYALEHEYVVLTNDTDFLDDPEVQVLYFPDNRIPAYELAMLVAEAETYHPEQSDLPGTLFLTRNG